MIISHDSEVPAEGQQVITACAFIHHEINGEQKLFLPRRAQTKKFLPGVFELPGGHIDFGEDIVEGLKREIMEELGMRVRIGDPFSVFDYENEVKGSHSVQINYFGQFEDSIENITLQPADHSEYIWFDGSDYSLLAVGDKDDRELTVIKKGFAILNGESLTV